MNGLLNGGYMVEPECLGPRVQGGAWPPTMPGLLLGRKLFISGILHVENPVLCIDFWTWSPSRFPSKIMPWNSGIFMYHPMPSSGRDPIFVVLPVSPYFFPLGTPYLVSSTSGRRHQPKSKVWGYPKKKNTRLPALVIMTFHRVSQVQQNGCWMG